MSPNNIYEEEQDFMQDNAEILIDQTHRQTDDFRNVIKDQLGLLTQPIVKANQIVRQSKFSLTLIESKIINYMLANLDQTKDSFEWIRFKTTDFCKACGMSKTNRKYVKDVIGSLSEKVIQVKVQKFDANNELISESYVPIRWLEDYEIKSDGYIFLLLHHRLAPYFLDLKKNFTKLQLAFLIRFRCKYSFPIYEILKSNANFSLTTKNKTYVYRQFVSGLRETLCLKDKFTKFSDMERRVLKPAIDEINEYTDLNVSYKFERDGRSVSLIYFKISYKDRDSVNQLMNDAALQFSAAFEDEDLTPIVLPAIPKRKTKSFLPSEDFEPEAPKAVHTQVVLEDESTGQFSLDFGTLPED